jgi:hypothetical protein
VPLSYPGSVAGIHRVAETSTKTLQPDRARCQFLLDAETGGHSVPIWLGDYDDGHPQPETKFRSFASALGAIAGL